MRAGVVFSLVLAAVCAVSTAARATEISWEPEGRFRLWAGSGSDPSAADNDLKALLADLHNTSSPSGTFARLVQFLHGRPTPQGGPDPLKTLLKQPRWIEKDAAYAADYIFPSTYRISASLTGAQPGDMCVWRAGDRPATPPKPCGDKTAMDAPALSELPGGKLAGPCRSDPEAADPAKPRVQRGVSTDLVVTVTSAAGVSSTLPAKPIQFCDRLVASLGDSFASGEGNPDIANDWSQFRPYRGVFGRWYDAKDPADRPKEDLSTDPFNGLTSDWKNRWLGRTVAVRGVKSAEWWDPRCHRSFHSQHMVAALKFTADHPDDVVTFVSYACSGAAIFNGLVTPQPRPPGWHDDKGYKELKVAQIEALNRDLCSTKATPDRVLPYDAVAMQPNGALRRVKGLKSPSFRCDGPLRQVDKVLLTVGGNDASFGDVIFDAMIPRQVGKGKVIGAFALNLLRDKLARLPEAAQATVDRTLADDMATLETRLKVVTGDVPVLQTTYPNPLQSQRKDPKTGEFLLCGPKDDKENWQTDKRPGAQDRLNLIVLNGAWPDRTVPENERWPMLIDQREADDIQRTMIASLNRLVTTEHPPRWIPVVGFERQFRGRGWCAAETEDGDFRVLPNYVRPVGHPDQDRWVPDGGPAGWRPYDHHVRLFRTPNDSALTEMSWNTKSVVGILAVPLTHVVDVGGRERLLAAVSGSFHPTFEAHVILGLALADTIEKPNRPPGERARILDAAAGLPPLP